MSTRSTASAVKVMRDTSDPSIASSVAGSFSASSSSGTAEHADSTTTGEDQESRYPSTTVRHLVLLL